MATKKKEEAPKAAPIITKELNTNPNSKGQFLADGFLVKCKVIGDLSGTPYAVQIGETATFPTHVAKELIEQRKLEYA
jgi:hypothetical protein